LADVIHGLSPREIAHDFGFHGGYIVILEHHEFRDY
jgi:hypothetical protein